MQARKEEQTSIHWHFTDILNVRPKLTEDQAMLVLGVAKAQHNPETGINWDVFRTIADDMFPTE